MPLVVHLPPLSKEPPALCTWDEIFSDRCSWDAHLAQSQTHDNISGASIVDVVASKDQIYAFAREILLIFWEFGQVVKEGIKCVLQILAFIHHAWVSDDRAWMFYIMVLGMIAITSMIYQKEHVYWDDKKKGLKLAWICDYLAFAVLLVSFAYFTSLICIGTWDLHAITELIIVSCAFRVTHAVVCAPLTCEIEPGHDLGYLPFPGYVPLQPLPRIIAYAFIPSQYE